MTGTAVESTTTETPPTRDRAWSSAVIGFTLLPFAVSAIRLAAGAGSGYHPYADQGTIESLVRDVGRHWLLLGPFSRFGWFHPGPALYYLLALPYRLTGSSSGSLAFAALCINALAVLGITLIARRRGGLPMLVLTAVFVLLLMRTLGAQFLRDPWNPYVTVLPFLLLLFAAWSIACGDRWALPLAAGVGSFVVQTHVGYALVVTVAVVAGVVGLVFTERSHRKADARGPSGPAPKAPGPEAWRGGSRQEPRRRRSWWPSLAATSAVLFVMWLPVAVQQITKDPGNVSQLVDFFGSHGREQRYEDAWHVLALQLGVWPDWLKGASTPSVVGTIDFSAALPIPLGLLGLIGATVLAWRNRSRSALLLDGIVLAVVAASFVAITRIVGGVLTYLVKWTWTLGTITWIAIAWSCVAAWQARARDRDRAAEAPRSQSIVRIGTYVLVAAFAAVVVVDTVSAARAGTPEPVASASMGKLGDAAYAALPERSGVVEVRVRGNEGAYWASAGVADVLEHHGADVRVGPELEFAYGPQRLVGNDPVRAVVLVADKGERANARALPGYGEVARDGGVSVFVGPP